MITKHFSKNGLKNDDTNDNIKKLSQKIITKMLTSKDVSILFNKNVDDKK